MKKTLLFALGALTLNGMFFSSCKEDEIEVDPQVLDNNNGKGDDNTPLAPGELSAEMEAKLATKTYTYGGVSFKMIYVKGGTFKMGAQPGDNTLDGYDSNASWSESPVHSVTLSSYAIGETEVTQELWNTMGLGTQVSLSTFPEAIGDQKPIFFITQNAMYDFIDLLNTKMHRSGDLDSSLMFDLPSEAQWEYAAKGGVKSKGYYYSGSNTLSEVAETGDVFSNVKFYMANELGLYDMTGNAGETCKDYWSTDGYYTDVTLNPVNTIVDDRVVCRGGFIKDGEDKNYRITRRIGVRPDAGSFFQSFRLVLVPVE